MAMLQYSLTMQNGFTVLAGEIGSGKTTLVRHLVSKIDPNITVGLITNTHESFGGLLQWVTKAFGLDYRGKDNIELYQLFTDFMGDQFANNRRTLLIIDEAQNMAPKTLEELRMLSNINLGNNQALQLILVGQPELRETLRQPNLKQFAQRICTAYFLEPLTEEETKAYIRFRLERAGGNESLFDDDSIRGIHCYSEGVPRVINTICDIALVYGFSTEQRYINLDTVKDVVKDQVRGGIFGAGKDFLHRPPPNNPVNALKSLFAPRKG